MEATLPNRVIAEWLSYKCRGHTVSFDIPPNWGDNFLGLALWVVYKCKATRSSSYSRAVITNMTVGITKNYNINVAEHTPDEVQSSLQCKTGENLLAAGDRIEISCQKLLYPFDDDGRYGFIWGENVPCGEVKVEMCGAHEILKSSFTY